MEPTIFQYVGGTVTNTIAAFVTPAAATLTTALNTFLVAGVTLYIMIMGWGICMGSIQAPAGKLIVQGLKIIIITSFVLAADTYANLVVGGFEALESLLANSLNGTAAANIYQVIDGTLGKGMALAMTCLENAETWHIGYSVAWLFAAAMVALGTIAIALLGGASIIAAKFLLALIFAVGPFFIVMLMFPITARLFDGWFSQAMNYTFVIVVISVVMSFAMIGFESFVLAADPAGTGDQHPVLIGAEVFILACVMGFIIQQSYGMAASLAGGLSMAALTFAHVATPGRIARGAVDPMSARRDLQSGMMVNARRHEHMIAGNTPVNPAYNQFFRQNMGRNWGRSKGGNVSQ